MLEMLGDSLEPLRAAVIAGRYSLLLGAGFSRAARNSHGRQVPSSVELAEMLMARFELPHGYSLAQLADAVDPDSLDELLRAEFKGCEAPASLKILSTFNWRYAFTFNVDDVIEDCYSTSSAMQRLRRITFKDRYEPEEDPGELHLVHLHGSVRSPEHGYVFSLQQYGASSAAESIWFTIASDLLATQPFLVIGCGLAEPDLEHYLARRKGLSTGGTQIAPSLYVAPDIDRVVEARCARLGLIPVRTDATSFLDALDHLTTPRPTLIDLLVSSRSATWVAEPPSESARRVFFRQWLDVRTSELPHPSNAHTDSSLLRGVEPDWRHISHGEDIVRQDARQLLADISNWAGVSSRARSPQYRILVGPAGCGKSTLLKRLAFELSGSGVYVLFYNALERLNFDVAADVLARMARPVVLVVDNTAEHAPQLVSLYESIRSLGAPAYIIGAERYHRLQRIQSVQFDPPATIQHCSKLTTPEAAALVGKLRARGLLGAEAGRSDAQISRLLTGRDLLSGIVSLASAGHAFDEAVAREWQQIESEDARHVYACIALAHCHGYPVRAAVIQRAVGISISEVLRLPGTVLRQLVTRVGVFDEYFRTRHRRVAEVLVRRLPEMLRFDLLVQLAVALAPYVNRPALRRGTPEARLAGRIFDYDTAVEPLVGKRSAQFYEAIVDSWQWNSRYWDQRALAVLIGEPLLALAYAEQSVGIERHPLTLTTLAKVHFRIAATVSSSEVRSEHWYSGLTIASQAIDLGRSWKRTDVYPFDVALRGSVQVVRAATARRERVDDECLERVETLMRDPALSMVFSKHELAELTRSWNAACDEM